MLRKPLYPSFALILLSACVGEADDKDDPIVDTDTVDPDGDTDTLAVPVLAISPASPMTADDLVAAVTNEDAAAAYTWAWTVNGASQTDLRSVTVPASRTAKGDVWCVNVVVAKAAETQGPIQTCVTIGNTPPVATVDLTPDDANSGDVLEAIPAWTDVDLDEVTLTYKWTYAEEGVSYSYNTDLNWISPSSLSKGQIWTVTVVPNDGVDDGEPVTDSLTILNSPPIVRSGTISPDAPTTNSLLTASYSADDPDGDSTRDLSYAWYVNGTALAGSVGTTLNGIFKFDKGDEVWFTVIVTDNETPTEPYESEHVTILDTAPSLNSASMTPTSALKGTTFECMPSGWEDADGDLEGYHYAWTVNGSTLAAQSSKTLAGAFSKGQTVGCIAAPFDGELEGAPQISNTVVVGNTPPTIGSVTMSDASPGLADTLSVLIHNAQDADGDAPITFTYQWLIDSVPVAAPAGTGATLTGVFGPADRVRVMVTPSDGFDVGVAVSSNNAVVGNHKPTADSLTLTPVPVRTDDMLTATATGSDLDGHPITFTYRWRVNNIVKQSGLSNRLDKSYFVKGDTVEVNATPNDGYEDGLPRTAGPITVSNSPPSLGGVTLGPSPATETTELTCTPSGFADADGDPASYVTAWSVNGATIASTATMLRGADFNHGDDVRCTITPFDGTVQGTLIASNTITIANTKPVLASATIVPAVPHTGDVLTVSTSGAFDADGDAIGFYTEWLIGGTVVHQGPSLAANRVRSGLQIQARVTPTDLSSTGLSVLSNEVVVANTDPTIRAFTLTPSTPTTEDTLTTSLTTSDFDGDTVTASYAWTVNGVVNPAAVAPTLPAADLKRDDVISVTVTVDDGHGGQATASAGPITVQNTAPMIGSVVITPLDPTETSVLTCTVHGVVDVDGDPAVATVAWRVNGAAAGTSPTLDGSAFGRGDGVICVATASDGTATSPGVPSDPVIIANTPPTLASAAISDPAPTAASLLLIDAGETDDADDDSVSLEVSWYINDVFFSAADSLGLGFGRGDVITAVVTPTDGITPGLPITTDPVTVLNSVPTVLSVAIGPTSPTQADTLVANVESFDADGDELAMSYDWYVDSVLVQSSAVGTLAPGPFSTGSLVHVIVTAGDGVDDSAPVSSGDITIGNAAPTLTSVTITPSPVVEASTPACVPEGWFDIDGDPEGYLYKWKINNVVRSVNPSINGLLFRRGDVLVCEVTPYDGRAFGTPVSSASVTVQNAPPTLVTLGLSNTSPREGDTVSVFVQGISDPDGDTVTSSVRWFVDDVQVLVGPTLTGTLFDKGQTVRATLDLSDGNTTVSFQTDVGVAINTVPRVTTLSASPSAPTVLDDIQATHVVVDPDPADTVTIAWAWSIAGTVDAESTTSTLAAGRARKHQAVTVSATPSDGESTGITITSVAVTVVNSFPSLLSVAISTPVSTSLGAVCGANGAFDADGDTVSVSYSWDISGTPGPGGTPMDPYFFGRGDVLTCKGTPSDGENFGPTLTSPSVVVGNSRPTLAAVVLSDDPVRETTLLSAMLIGAADADNDIITPAYEWLVNGEFVSTETLINGALFSRGDTVQVRVQLSDGMELSDAVLSPVAVVANSPPQIVGAPTVEPNPALTTSVITGVAAKMDPDGDPVTLRWVWYVNDTQVLSGASATLDGSYFARGDQVHAIVFPNDGLGEGIGVPTYSATISNSRPSVPTVTISPSRPTPHVDAVTCSIANPGVDPDGDPLTYVFAWVVDGVGSGAATTVGTTSTLPASAVDASVLIFCQASATDGDLASAYSAAAIVNTGAGVREDCKGLRAANETTDGYYVVDDDGAGGSAPPYEVYCDQTFDRGGWTRVLRTDGHDMNFGQDAYSIVSTFADAHASSGVYEAFGAYRKWNDILIRAVSGAQAGQYRVFQVASEQLTMLEMLETCRDETVHFGDDLIFDLTRTVGHTSYFTATSYGGDLSIQRAVGGAPLPAHYFFMCGVNTSSDNDVAYLSFSDSIGSENDWVDAWRGQNQIGTLWSFANDDYCCSGSSNHIGNGAMQGYAGWKGQLGTPAESWHAGTYEIYLR